MPMSSWLRREAELGPMLNCPSCGTASQVAAEYMEQFGLTVLAEVERQLEHQRDADQRAKDSIISHEDGDEGDHDRAHLTYVIHELDVAVARVRSLREKVRHHAKS